MWCRAFSILHHGGVLTTQEWIQVSGVPQEQSVCHYVETLGSIHHGMEHVNRIKAVKPCMCETHHGLIVWLLEFKVYSYFNMAADQAISVKVIVLRYRLFILFCSPWCLVDWSQKRENKTVQRLSGLTLGERLKVLLSVLILLFNCVSSCVRAERTLETTGELKG